MTADHLEVAVALANNRLQFTGELRSQPAITLDYVPPLGDGQGYLPLELMSLAACSGLPKSVVSWQPVAEEAVRRFDSKSRIEVEDRGWGDEPLYWDVSGMKNDFGPEFDPRGKIGEHPDHHARLIRAQHP